MEKTAMGDLLRQADLLSKKLARRLRRLSCLEWGFLSDAKRMGLPVHVLHGRSDDMLVLVCPRRRVFTAVRDRRRS